MQLFFTGQLRLSEGNAISSQLVLWVWIMAAVEKTSENLQSGKHAGLLNSVYKC